MNREFLGGEREHTRQHPEQTFSRPSIQQSHADPAFEENRRSRHPAGSAPDRSRHAWICCRYPVFAAGLERVLRGKFRVHRGLEPPRGSIPFLVVFFAEDAEALPESVERARRPNPDALLVAFGPEGDLSLARAALRAGARGYIHTAYTPEQILRALAVVEDGGFAAPRELLEYLVTGTAGEEPSPNLKALSDRQREILALIADDLSNAQIARRLFLSESTVKQHLRAAYRLLGVKKRAEAARLAAKLIPDSITTRADVAG